MDGRVSERLVGRADALRRLDAAVSDAAGGRATTVLVSGSAGMGKSSLLRGALADLAEVAATPAPLVAWGTSPAGTAPGYWPWTQALTSLVRQAGREACVAAAGDDATLLASLVPALGSPTPGDGSDRHRLLLLDAAVAWLQELATQRPVVVVLDDLHWMDGSSLALLELLVADPRPSRLCVLGAYRHDEPGVVADRLATLAERTSHVHLGPLDDAAAARLVGSVGAVEDHLVAGLVRRAGGHPLFLRELGLAAASGDALDEVPAVVREAVALRLARLGAESRQVLRAAAVAGRDVDATVVSEVLDLEPGAVDLALSEAVTAGLLGAGPGGRHRFVHDVHREVVVGDVPPEDRPAWHRRTAEALARRRAAPAEVAGHFCAGLSEGCLDEAVHWSLAAAAADRSALALGDAADRLRRLRQAAADAGLVLPPTSRVEVLLVEADLLARTGRLPDARGLLRAARAAADEAGDVSGAARAALASAALGARFAVRRDELLADLTSARDAVAGHDPGLEARVTAALARELAHSVPDDRARSGPLAEAALELGRTTGDDDVLAACLLARHDLLWTPGTADERAGVTAELVELARRGDQGERLAEALVLHANALLEGGRAGFSAVLDEALVLLDELGQPRHRYTRLTRLAARALLAGEPGAASLVEEAAALGERLREPDAGNVRMSQRLELVRAGADPGELLDFAEEAVRHWTGAPVHAHAVAAGFCARAGDLDRARHHVAAVVDLGTWRSDRSYLWSVFVRELAAAATALEDRALCAELLADLDPLGASCGVNGAVVAFAGCHAHAAGLLAAALGDVDGARRRLEEAVRVYERLGAAEVATVRAELDLLGSTSGGPAMTQRGAVWEVAWAGRSATVRDCKGLHDIAALVSRPGRDVAALDLAGGGPDPAADPVIDGAAAAAYRSRLHALSAEREEAAGDELRLAQVEAEHAALVAELGRGTGIGGRRRTFANHPAERARKAVAARIRDAVRRIGVELPELAVHLDRTLVTGTRCRYTGDHRWTVG